MSVAPEVIDRVEALGVTITVEGADGIGLDPIDKVPDALKTELKSQRSEVVAALRLRDAINRPDGLEYLLGRLCNGQRWLDITRRDLEATSNGGLGDIEVSEDGRRTMSNE